MRAGLQRRPRVLGRRRTVPGVVLSTQVSPEEGARARGNAKGGRVPSAEGRRRVRIPPMRAVPEVPVGLTGKAKFISRGQGRNVTQFLFLVHWEILSYAIIVVKIFFLHKILFIVNFFLTLK